MEGFFKLKKHGTSVGTEIIAGLTTFFAMVYIIFVNSDILSATGMPWGGVFLATIIASVIGTLVMGLVANVPYALAPGMGLNVLFMIIATQAGFTWQEALAMVFICGIINIIITVTKLRKSIIKAIPRSLQSAIGGGIGLFIAYIGVKNANLVAFSEGSQSIAAFDNWGIILAFIGLVIVVVLMALNVRGAIILSIIATTVIGIIVGKVEVSAATIDFGAIGKNFQDLGKIFGAALGSEGIGSLFADTGRIPLVLSTIFAFSLADTFDTIGTFIGTGRRTGIFDEEDERALEESKGFKSKMDKALFADSIATSIGAILGTSNTTTYIESSAGIAEGGRTGLTSVVTALAMLACIIISPIAGLVPAEATAPALIIVGVLMAGAFADINWTDFEEALPAFFAAAMMVFFSNISDGIAFGFIFYCIVKVFKGKYKEVHPIVYGATILFILNYVIGAVQ